MTWIRVDDHFADHPKVMALGKDRLSGLGLWHVAASYTARHLTDGFVPRSALILQGPAALTEKMVGVGLFVLCDGGYRLHDWLDYNPPRAKILSDRQAAKDRMASGRVREKPSNSSVELRAPRTHAPPVSVSTILSEVSSKNEEAFVEPADLYAELAHRKSLSQKERNWLEDLHVRFSRRELVRALKEVGGGPDLLKRVDAHLEGAS